MQKVKFLIIRFSSIGDIVLTTPVIRCLKQQVEFAEVHFLTKPQYKEILNYNPFIDKLHLLEESIDDTVKLLKKEGFDYIIDLHHNIRTQYIKRKLNRVSFSFNKLNIEKWILVNFKINKLPTTHIVDRYLKTIELFDVKNDYKGLDYFINESEDDISNTLPDLFKEGYVAVVLGAQHATKRIPEDKIFTILSKIKRPIVLLGGKEDDELGKKIESKLKEKVFNSCGKYSINQSASIIRKSTIVLTHDTGLMHIAAAYKKKIISVWGNTIPEFGMYPYLPSEYKINESYWIIEVDGLSCRPCSKIGYNKCPKKHFKCMYNINEQQIVDIIENVFADEKKRF